MWMTGVLPRDRRATVGIVGAGPAGLSLARLLTERGVRDVTVLERTRRVGGKSLTVQHEGLGHEVGTCYHTWGYHHIQRWMRRFGISAHRLRRHVIHPIAGAPVPFARFVCPGSRAELAGELARYGAAWAQLRRADLRGVDRARFDAEAAIPFAEWLRERKFRAIERFALRSMTAMGYGHLEQVPTLYGLRWNTPALLLSAVALRVDEPVPGWQRLWEALAATLDVRLGWETVHIDRGPRGVTVYDASGRITRFDQLVIASPLDGCGAFVPLTPAEKAVFAQLRWGRYATALLSAEGWFTREDTHAFEAALVGARGAGVGDLLVARRTGDKTPVAGARASERPNIYVAYQYASDQLGDDALRARLHRDIRRQGAEVRAELGTWRWRYAPQLTTDAIARGAVWEMEALQGARNTWYTGAALSHEAVGPIVSYNARLADRICGSLGRGGA